MRYLALWRRGGEWIVCSSHVTLAAAERAAQRCEQKGGARHIIVEAKLMSRSDGASRKAQPVRSEP